MATISLDKFREGLDKKHSSTTIPLPDGGAAVLRNALRMPKADRKALNEAFDSWRERYPTEDDEDGKPQLKEGFEPATEEEICAHLANIITLLIGDKKVAARLLALDIDDSGVPLKANIAALDYIMELHAGELGEA